VHLEVDHVLIPSFRVDAIADERERKKDERDGLVRIDQEIEARFVVFGVAARRRRRCRGATVVHYFLDRARDTWLGSELFFWREIW